MGIVRASDDSCNNAPCARFHRRTMPASWLIRALTLGLLAITLPLAARGLYGPQGAWVHVRWQPSVDAAERQRLETAWQLVDGQEVSLLTWRYDLTAPTGSRLRAIVEHAAVADTHYIDRQRYALTPETSRTGRRHSRITVGSTVAVGLVDRLAVLLAVLAGLCALVRHPMRVSRGAVAAVARWLQRNLGLIGAVAWVRPFRPDAVCRWLPIPTLTARSLGKFRVVFGLALFYVVFSDPSRAQPLEMHRNYGWLADWSLVHAVAASVTTCRVLHGITLALAGLFIVGLWTRPAYVALVVGIFVSQLVELHSAETHDWELLLLTLFALTVVPWGDGFSLDARLTRRPGRKVRAGPLYGLAIWIPGFTLGLAFAAAAYAKLTNGGLAWITSGAVKYHFIADATNAPVTWGLWVAAHPSAAVLLSLGVVVIEACFISIIFVRSPWRRLLLGGVGLSLMAGFYVFQGVIWEPWLLLFVALLPWPLLDHGASPPATVSNTALLRAPHVLLLAALAGQQALVSVSAVEVKPLLSNYPMYSHTFESPEVFERSRYRYLQRLRFESGGADVSARVQAIQNASEELFDAAEDIAAGERIREQAMASLLGVRKKYQTRYGVDLDVVTVTADRVTFDWQQGRFNPPTRVRIADVPLPDAGLGSR